MHIFTALSLTMLMVSLMTGTEGTDRPIVGILAQELPWIFRLLGRTSFVPASYVEAVEASGARTVPIFINKSIEYYKHIMTSINGVVFPGGSTDFSAPHGYGATGRIVMDIAQKLQDSGVSFPILGVCQGFQLLMYLAANSTSEDRVLVGCNATNVALPLDFRPGFNRSSLFRHASHEIIEILQNLPVTSNHHRFCVTEKTLKSHGLQKTWQVLSTNRDVNDMEFISSVEHFHRPFVGLQFHPEVNAFKWNLGQANPHSHKAILSARHFYDWLVDKSKANNQSFASAQEEHDSLFSNYCPGLMYRNTSSEYRAYIFN